MKKSLELRVSGEVQGVGYRRAVQKIARTLNVVGYVKNQPDGTVRIVAEGEGDKTLDEFARAVALDRAPIRVENVSKRETRPSGRYKFFKIVSGSIVEELQEGFGSIESQFNEYRGEFRTFADRTDWNFKILREK